MRVRALLFVTIFLARHETSAGLGKKTKKGKHPTMYPSFYPTYFPTQNPTKKQKSSKSPTSDPTGTPTGTPIGNPTGTPTGTPSTPTGTPTGTPTDTPTGTPIGNSTGTPTGTPIGTPTSTPETDGLGRFSYKASDPLGPLEWEDADSTHNEWEQWEPLNVKNNECGKEKNRQSPVDLVKNEKCTADHEMLFDDGSCKLSDAIFEVTPYSLKTTFPIRDCTPPALDLSDSFHARYVNTIEIKVPGEHTINGTSFDGEMQFSFVVNVKDEHKDNRDHQIAMTVRHLEASKSKDDSYIELFLEEWETVADRKAEECASQGKPLLQSPLQLLAQTQRRHRRRLLKSVWSVGKKKKKPRLLRQPFRNQYYYGYKGSLTVPPCSDIVLWYVVDNPMEISPDQLRRLRYLVANYLNAQCELGTYADEEGNVNRPLQKKHRHNIFHCDESDYSN